MSQTPIRVGEMEVTNLLLAKSPETVEKLLKTYATNENLREELITKLLDPGKLENGHMRNALNMDIDVDLRNNKSISREILEKYMNVLGFSLIDSYDDENQPEGK